MACMIILTVKLLRYGQINFGHEIVVGLASVPTILSIFTTMAAVKIIVRS